MSIKEVKRRNSTTGYRMIRRYLSGEKSVSAFCRQEGISVAGFYVWKRRYFQEFGHLETEGTPTAIYPVSLVESPVLASSGLELIYPNGVKLRMDSKSSPEMIRQLIHLA